MIFKPSYRIENTENTEKDLKKILYLEDNFDGEIGSSIWLIKNKTGSENESGLGTEYTKATIDNIDESNKKKIIVLLESTSEQKYELLVDLGNAKQDFLMGINAGNNRIGPNQELEGRGLTSIPLFYRVCKYLVKPEYFDDIFLKGVDLWK